MITNGRNRQDRAGDKLVFKLTSKQEKFPSGLVRHITWNKLFSHTS